MGWHVTGQVETKQMTQSGRFIPAIEVHFVTDDGTDGTVTVPKSAYSAATVKERIDTYVGHLSDVADLTG